MENNIKFVEGMNFRQVPQNAPETVRGSISFKVKDMIQFLIANEDEKGWVNIKMMKSKNTGGIYFILDTYKPRTDSAESKEYNDTKYKHPDPNVQAVNEKSAEKLFNQPLSEEEQFNLSQIPF